MQITGYEFGRITINSKIFTDDLIIHGQEIVPNWRRKGGHLADIEDIKRILLEEGTHLIIGTGYYGMMKISHSLEEYCKKHNIILEAMRTKSAIEVFNSCDKSEKLVGAFHLTC